MHVICVHFTLNRLTLLSMKICQIIWKQYLVPVNFKRFHHSWDSFGKNSRNIYRWKNNNITKNLNSMFLKFILGSLYRRRPLDGNSISMSAKQLHYWDIELKCFKNIQRFSSLIQKSVSVVLNFLMSLVWKNLWSERNYIQVFKLLCQSKDFIELHLAIDVTFFQVSSSKHLTYHSMIIKFCLAIAAKSPTAYEEIRLNQQKGSGILILSSQRTLRDYRNYIGPQCGFNPEVVNELTSKTQDFTDMKRFTILLFDEMKVHKDLVCDKNPGNLLRCILFKLFIV